jgi:hypothetical protein
MLFIEHYIVVTAYRQPNCEQEADQLHPLSDGHAQARPLHGASPANPPSYITGRLYNSKLGLTVGGASGVTR